MVYAPPEYSAAGATGTAASLRVLLLASVGAVLSR
jgi:hypothetical protein